MKNKHFIPILLLIAALFAACKGPAPALQTEQYRLYLNNKTAKIEYHDGRDYAIRFDNVITNEKGTTIYRFGNISPVTRTADGKVRFCDECFLQVGYQQCLARGYQERECALVWNQPLTAEDTEPTTQN